MFLGYRRGRARRQRSAAAVVLSTAVLAATATSLFLPLSGSARPQAAPDNTSQPEITGTARVGQTLAASTGSWTGTTPITFAFQWVRCDSDGSDCDETITGATGQAYVVQQADVGSRLRVRVTATNSEGSAVAISEPTAVVAATGVPRNTAEPRVSGSAVEGQRLTTTTGTWTGAQPIAFSFRWVRCGTDGGAPDGSNCPAINGATSSSYVLTSADVGRRLRVRVTATNSAGSATVASNPTRTVAPGRAPVNTRMPSVTGTWVEGATVTLNRGTWTGAASFSQQWLRCNTGGGACVAIPGATGTQHRLTASDVGHKIRVDVTAGNSVGATTVRSTESATVAPAGPAGVLVLPSGERSIPATSVPANHRLVVAEVRFTPNPVRSRTAPIIVRVRVRDTRGFVVRSALVFARSTPLVTRAIRPRQPTATDGWVTFTMQPRFTFPRPRNGFNVQFFVKAYRTGDPPLAGVAAYRLVQVRLAR